MICNFHFRILFIPNMLITKAQKKNVCGNISSNVLKSQQKNKNFHWMDQELVTVLITDA